MKPIRNTTLEEAAPTAALSTSSLFRPLAIESRQTQREEGFLPTLGNN